MFAVSNLSEAPDCAIPLQVKEHNNFYEQLHKFDIMNTKVGSENTLLGHLMGRHGFVDLNSNDKRFVDFSNFHRLGIGGTLFKNTHHHSISTSIC